MNECYFCGARLPLAASIEAGWAPCFYKQNNESVDHSVCSSCSAKKLKVEADGEFTLVEE